MLAAERCPKQAISIQDAPDLLRTHRVSATPVRISATVSAIAGFVEAAR
jgi:hypothetical protein